MTIAARNKLVSENEHRAVRAEDTEEPDSKLAMASAETSLVTASAESTFLALILSGPFHK